MKYFKYILLALVLFWAGRAEAQQDPIYAQYMNQILSINPAYAGARGVTSASMLIRTQPIKGKATFGNYNDPRTMTLFVHSPFGADNGIGGSILVDEFGPEKRMGLYGDYSFSITFPGNRYFSLGLKAGFSWYEVVYDPSLSYDPVFAQPIKRPFLPNAGVGAYYSSPDYYIGFAIPKLISNRLSSKVVETGVETVVETGYVSREQIHAFFMGGYVFDVNRIIKFKPYFMLRVTPNAPLSLDLTAQFVFIEKLWLGGTYRFGNALGFMAQVQLNEQMRFGVAYDLTTTDLRAYNTGILEGMFTFDFSFGRSRVRSPRYF